ncbi:acyl-CoA thioesterase [Craterilacuibacter sp.]|uniref:acyl-CoA thioesterase n=1 Tax=Craterilacuibacter sp. TaxID=2870909 RepID=UPI003F34EB74
MEKHYPVLGEKSIVMRWGDMDAIGHLNNAVYFRYLEQIRIDWLEEAGFPITPDGIGPVIAHTACHFKREIAYPNTLHISIELEHLGRSSLKLRHRFFCAEDRDTVYAVGEVTLVWVDYRQGKSVPIPQAIRDIATARLIEN